MDILGTFLSAITKPSGFWENIIFAFEGGLKNYALAIILLTLCIKVIWLPFDFFNRKMSRKQQKMQAVLQPEVEKIQKRYGSDKQVVNQKLSQLYQKNNYNIWGSCIFMLVFLVLNMVIFFTLFGGLNNVSSYKIATQYQELKNTYVESIYMEVNGTTPPTDYTNEDIKALADLACEEIKQRVNLKVKEKYDEIKTSFLWIENVWKADSPFQSCIPNFDDYAKTAKLSKEEIETEKEIYNIIMTPLDKSINRVNGYFILALLAAGTSILSVLLSSGKLSKKDKVKAPPQNKFMLLLMPIIMFIFALLYNSIFSLYMVVGQIVSILFAPLINLIILKLEQRADKKKADKVEVVDYRRK